MKKIEYWEGLRSIFCIIVVISHVFLAFYPLAPAFLVSMGNLAVMYFLLLSGGLTTFSVYNSKRDSDSKLSLKELLKYCLKRYLRLLPVVCVSIMCSVLIYMCGFYWNDDVALIYELEQLFNYFPENLTLYEGVFEAFIGAFYRRPLFNTPFWTIKYELFGIIGVYFLVRVCQEWKYRWIVYSACEVFFLLVYRDIYVVCLITGVILFELFYVEKEFLNKFQNIIQKVKWLYVFALIVTLLINLVWSTGYFRFLFAIELIVGCLCYEEMQKIFSCKPLVKLSKYTFSIYATHWLVICSFVCFLVYKLCDIHNYIALSLAINVVGCVVIFVVGWLMFYLIERPCSKLIKKIKM